MQGDSCGNTHTYTHTQMCIRNELELDSSESWQNKLGLIAVNEQRMKSVKLILHHLHPGEGNERFVKGREMWLREELRQSKMPLSASLAFLSLSLFIFFFHSRIHSPFFTLHLYISSNFAVIWFHPLSSLCWRSIHPSLTFAQLHTQTI